MKVDPESLNDSQKEAVIELDKAMKNLFGIFVKIDSVGIPIADSLELIGMEIPLLLRPAVNQLSGKLKQIRKEENEELLSA